MKPKDEEGKRQPERAPERSWSVRRSGVPFLGEEYLIYGASNEPPCGRAIVKHQTDVVRDEDYVFPVTELDILTLNREWKPENMDEEAQTALCIEFICAIGLESRYVIVSFNGEPTAEFPPS